MYQPQNNRLSKKNEIAVKSCGVTEVIIRKKIRTTLKLY